MPIFRIPPFSRGYFPARHQDKARAEPERLLLRSDDWIHRFSSLFKAGNHLLSDRARVYFRGLIQADRANIERISYIIPDSNYQRIHHFISESPWDDGAVRATNTRIVDHLLGGTPFSGLLIDETPITKKGRESVGVARQWNGQLGKVDNCQVAVFTALTNCDHATLIGSQLYLPQEWVDDPQRCSDAGIPPDRSRYQSKTDMALDLIDEADALGVRYEWIGVDAGYGKHPGFLRELIARGKIFFADVHKTERIYTTNPSKRRRVPHLKRLSTTPKPMTVAEWVAKQPSRKWKSVIIRKTPHKTMRAKILHGRVWVWSQYDERPQAWHLIVRRRGDKADKYTLSNAPGDIPTPALAWYQAQRAKIEQAFQEAKQLLGLGDYQIRGWRAWQHHVTLAMMTMGFLLNEKIQFGREYPGFTLPEVCDLLLSLMPSPNFNSTLRRIVKKRMKWSKVDEDPPPI